MPNPKNNQLNKILFFSVFLIVLFVVQSCFFIVRKSEGYVITSFENPIKTITTPGLCFKLPYPIQNAYPFDLKNQLFTAPAKEQITRDGSSIIISSFTTWAISDPLLFKNKIGPVVSAGNNIIADIASMTIKSIISTKELSDFSNPDHASGMEAIEKSILIKMQDEAKDHGITVKFFGFNRLQLPESTTQSVLNRMRSEQEKIVSQIINEGKTKKSK